MKFMNRDWGKFGLRVALVSLAVVALSFLLGMVMQYVSAWTGAFLGGAIYLLLQVLLFMWALTFHKGKEDFLAILATAGLVTVVLTAIGSFISLPILQYSFNLTGGIGTLVVSIGTILIADAVVSMVVKSKA